MSIHLDEVWGIVSELDYDCSIAIGVILSINYS